MTLSDRLYTSFYEGKRLLLSRGAMVRAKRARGGPEKTHGNVSLNNQLLNVARPQPVGLFFIRVCHFFDLVSG